MAAGRTAEAAARGEVGNSGGDTIVVCGPRQHVLRVGKRFLANFDATDHASALSDAFAASKHTYLSRSGRTLVALADE